MRACSATRVFSGMSSNGPTARAASTHGPERRHHDLGLAVEVALEVPTPAHVGLVAGRERAAAAWTGPALAEGQGRDEVAQEQVAVALEHADQLERHRRRQARALDHVLAPAADEQGGEGEEELVQGPLREQRADDARAPLRTARRARRGGAAGRAMRRRSPATRRRGRPPSRRARSRSRGAAPRTGGGRPRCPSPPDVPPIAARPSALEAMFSATQGRSRGGSRSASGCDSSVSSSVCSSPAAIRGDSRLSVGPP